MARKLCRAHIDPDDLIQDLLEKLMRTQPLPEVENERAWLARILHNLFIDKLRRHQARREDLGEDEPAAPVTDQVAWWEALGEDAVRAAANQLSPEQRTTFELFAFEGKSYDQIAAQLRIAKATVGTRILRARLRLRELLTAQEGA